MTDRYIDDVADARAALRMVRDALEQYGTITQLPPETEIGPRPTDEAAEQVKAVIRLAEAALLASRSSGR